MDSFKFVVNGELLSKVLVPFILLVVVSLIIIVITFILVKKELGSDGNEKE